MKRIRIVLLVTASLGLLLGLFWAISNCSEPTLAAPPLKYTFSNPPRDTNPISYLPVITCTLATTTTDSLASEDNYTYTKAVALANYTGLALSTGDEGASVPAEDDWFRIDNATVDSIYEVGVFPDKTTNYNLGIVVYDADIVQVVDIDDDTSNNSASVTFPADTQGPYYLKVYQISAQCTGETYNLDFSKTPPTPPPVPAGQDSYESNNNSSQAYTLPVQTSVTLNLTFHDTTDEDWFKLWGKAGKWYQVTTSGLSNVDTYLEISGITTNDDYSEGYASQVTWQASNDGYYYIKVTNQVNSTGSYDMTMTETDAPPTDPTATPANPSSGSDSCEDNSDFEDACILAANKSYTFNLYPPYGNVDNDYFKLWIKPGFIFECTTSDLDPGIDPNMIVYDQNQTGIGGNDDIKEGDLNSTFSYYALYEGWLYVLIGTGNRTPSDISNSNYTLRCDRKTPNEATETPDSEPTGTPTGETTPMPTSSSQTPTPGATTTAS